MKTKLFMSIVAVISALSIASAVADCEDDISKKTITEETYTCGIFTDWDDVIC